MVFGDKKLFKNKEGDIHVGINAPTDFTEATIEDVKTTMASMGNKRFWRCFICNDLHIGQKFPEDCPTCLQKNVYIQVDEVEIKGFLELN